MRVSPLSSIMMLILLGTFCLTRGCFQIWGPDRILGEHADDVHSIRVSPDGKWVVSRSPKEVRVWSTTGGKDLVLPSDQRDLALSPQSEKLLVTLMDGGAAGWDLKTGTCGKTLGKEFGIASLGVFSPNDRLVVAAFDGYKVCVWDTASGTQVAALKGSPPYNTMRFSADGKMLLWPGAEPAAWDTASWCQTEAPWSGEARSGALSPKGTECLCFDGTIIEVPSCKVLAKLDGFQRMPADGGFLADGKTVVVWFADGTMRTWDSETGALKATWRWLAPPVGFGSMAPVRNWNSLPVRLKSVAPSGQRMLINAPRDPDLWRAAEEQPRGMPVWMLLGGPQYQYSIRDSSGRSVGSLGPGINDAAFCGDDKIIAAAGPGNVCSLWTQRRPASIWGLLAVPATWGLLVIAAGLVWLLISDWKARSEEFGTYAPVGDVILISAWSGLLTMLVVPELLTPFAKDAEHLFYLSLQIGFPVAMAIAAAVSLRKVAVRAAALFAPLALGGLAIFVVHSLYRHPWSMEPTLFTYSGAALAVGIVAGLAKRRARAVVLGVIGGLLGAVATFVGILKFDHWTDALSFKLPLYLALAAVLSQLPAVLITKSVPDPEE